MNVGFDAKRLYNNFTGLGNYSRFVVQALMNEFPMNHYCLFTPRVKHNSDTKQFINSSSVSTIVPPHWINVMKGGSLWRTLMVGKEALKKNVDLFHGLSGELPIGLKKIPSVVTIHDLIFYRFPKFYKPIDVAIYKSKVKHACKTADLIIAISKQTAFDVQEFIKIDESRINVIYQGVHPNFRKEYSVEEIEVVKKKYNLPPEFILTVGTIEPRKNALSIVRALQYSRIDIPLVLVGRATNYISEIKAYASKHHMSDRVIYLQNVSFNDLPAIYRSARLFIYPSLFEGFGIPLIEAINCGIPVITSRGSCFEEAAGPFSIYVDPNQREDLAFQIERVLSDDMLRSSMILQSLIYVTQFEPQQIASNLMNAYNNVVDGHR